MGSLLFFVVIPPGEVNMWKTIAIAALALTVSSAWAQDGPDPKAAMTRALIAKQATQLTPGYRACSFCYSCGWPWPYFAGTFRTPYPTWTVERGASCQGALTYRTDYTPYLCCGLDQ